jgi:hypothetical protein
MASLPGGQAETGIVRIGMSPSKPRMGEIKLSKVCIQGIEACDLEKIEKIELNRAPYWVPFYPDMVGVHLLVG